MSKRKKIPDVMSDLQGLAPKREEPRPTPPQRETSPILPTPARPNQNVPARKRKRSTPKSRLIRRATYEIGPELKEVIHDEAVRLGVSDSQFARYLLLFAWDFYLDKSIPEPVLSESSSPRYRHNIEFE